MDIKCGSNRSLVTAVIALLVLLCGGGHAHATTEFVCTIKNSGGDYSTLNAWQSSNHCDLTASETKVFSHQGITGTINDGDSVIGQTSGATGTAMHVTSSQILIRDISGTFQSGEQVYRTENTDFVIMANAGDSAIAVAECYDSLAEDITVTGWTTDSVNHIKITTADGGTLTLTGDVTVSASGAYVVLACNATVTNVTVDDSSILKVLGDKTLTATNNVNIGTSSSSDDTACIICGGLTGEITEEHSPPPAWYDGSWNNVQKFTIDHTKIDAELSDFPLLVKLNSSSSDLFGKAQSDGDDILFTASDGTTKLDHEIEKYIDTSGSEQLVAHVRIPTVSATQDTVFYMYYGNSGAVNQQNPTGVWDTNYKAVWHLGEDALGTGTTGLYEDSTSNSNNGDDYVSATGKTGKMGNGQEFDGSDDYGQAPYHSSLDVTDTLTVAAWVKPASEHNGGILEKTVGGTVNTQYLFFLNSGSGARFRVHKGSTNYTATSDSYPSIAEWTYVVGRYDGAEVSVWVNGEKQPTTAAVASPISSGNGVTLIGHLGSSVYPFNGPIDEVRVSDTPRSDAWIKASYHSQNNTLLASGDTNRGVSISAANINVHGSGGVGGSITATGQGFPHDEGTGAGGTGSSGYGGGAGYGGGGGDSDDGGIGGLTYGSSTDPLDLGSGGGSSGGGSGGGAIALDVSGTLTVDGLLASNGSAATSNGGGGSGGSIKAICGTLTGGGAIRANGGAGAGHGGGGGAGRIYMRYDSTSFTGTCSSAIHEDHSSPPTWYDASWQYSQKFTINYGKIDEILTNFPLLVKLDSSNSDVFDKAQSDGDDILFTASDGTTKLDHEIEKYVDTEGNEELVAHVRIPTVSVTQDTVFYMYYGNGGASNQANPTGVWDANYKAVWHLCEDPTGTAPQMGDSTANANNATTRGSMTTGDQVAGKTDGALSFDGTDDYLEVADSTSLDITGAITIQAWVKIDSYPTEWNLIAVKGDTSTGRAYGMWIRNTGDILISYYNGAYYHLYPAGQGFTTGIWHHLVGVIDTVNDLRSIYIDGVLKASDSSAVPPMVANDFLLYTGSRVGTWPTNGVIDEVRISDTARSPSWIKASHRSQDNTLLTSGGNSGGIKGSGNTLPSEDGNGADSAVYEADTVADTAYWNNETGNGLWSDPDNWSTGKVPGFGDTLIFDGNYSTTNCTLGAVEDNLASIVLEDDYNGQVTFNADLVSGGESLP